jgi:hypothetical protein
MRAGLSRELPPAATALLTWRQLERAACGSRNVSVDVLRAMADESGIQGRPQQAWLWRTLEGFTDARRAQFLAFATGRSRAPEKPRRGQLVLEMLSSSWLPHGSTCALTFGCAAAPSEERLASGLNYALDHARGIHGDGDLRVERQPAGDDGEEEEEEEEQGALAAHALQEQAGAGGELTEPLFDDDRGNEDAERATPGGPPRDFFADDGGGSDGDDGGGSDRDHGDGAGAPIVVPDSDFDFLHNLRLVSRRDDDANADDYDDDADDFSRRE